MKTRADALATLKHAILMGLSERAHLTKIQAGVQGDMVVEDIFNALLQPHYRWIFTLLAESPEDSK